MASNFVQFDALKVLYRGNLFDVAHDSLLEITQH